MVSIHPGRRADSALVFSLYALSFGHCTCSTHHPLLARLIQILLSSLNVWLAYRIGARLFNGRVGLAAATLTAVYAYFIFYNAAVMTQTFYILALLGAIDWRRAGRNQNTPDAGFNRALSPGLRSCFARRAPPLFTPILLALDPLRHLVLVCASVTYFSRSWLSRCLSCPGRCATIWSIMISCFLTRTADVVCTLKPSNQEHKF